MLKLTLIYFISKGFTEEELEKPYFPGKTDAGPKVPFVLSEEGTQKTVEVNYSV